MKDIETLLNRRHPSKNLIHRHISKAASVANESYEWLVEATKPIDPEYTNDTFAEGDRIRDQLLIQLDSRFSSEFEYQGSVTSDTHVRFHSDIDLLVLHGVYTSYPNGYISDSKSIPEQEVLDALVLLRNASTTVIRRKFPEAIVDTSGSKAVSVSGGDLERDIDVVFCNWWNTQEYLDNKVLANRGICVLEVGKRTRINNRPFLHNWHINSKDDRVNGGLRKVIRLLKNLKYDKKPQEASISSYDIAGIAFNMAESDLKVGSGQYLKLAKNASGYLHNLIENSALRDNLFVPNHTRKVFGPSGTDLSQLKELSAELDALLFEITSTDEILINFSESSASPLLSAAWHENRASRVTEINNKFGKSH